jgi:perosamine synthetase
LQECIETGWVSSEGPFVKRLEIEFAARTGRRHGVAVSSGSAALDIAVAALDIGPGDEVIMPAFTIISCAAAVVRSGARPVFVDSDPQSWTMDVTCIEQNITPRTRAIMPVHIYGLPVDMDPLLKLADKHGLAVIEDAAEAHGSDYRDRPCGSMGAISTFSFYPNKLVTTGEGGMLLTDDEKLADRCRSLRNLCFRSERRFVHEELGWNYRMSNLQAAVGVAQLERLDEFVAIKKQLGRRYRSLLQGTAGLQLPLLHTEYAENVFWVFGIVLEEEVDMDAREAMRRLGQEGIGTRPFFWPMHEQPVMNELGFGSLHELPVAERLARRGFYVPCGLGLTEVEAEKVAASVEGMLR